MTSEYVMHVGICVRDLARSIRFYCEGLGFEEQDHLEIEGEPTASLLGLDEVDLHAVYLQKDGFRIELLDYRKPGVVGEASARPMNALGLTHFAIRVPDLDAKVEQLIGLGGHLLPETRVDNEVYASHVVYVTDPDGTRLELAQMPVDPTRAGT